LRPVCKVYCSVISLAKTCKRSACWRETLQLLLCSKSFAQRDKLQAHVTIHTGEKPYSCSQCAKSFATSSHLQRHVRGVHTGEKPYTCSLCSKSFAQRYKLQAHVRIHSGEKSHSCLQCTKSFTQPGDLQIHLRVHTGENRTVAPCVLSPSPSQVTYENI
jgi:uncharacterized Zn-finger protein